MGENVRGSAAASPHQQRILAVREDSDGLQCKELEEETKKDIKKLCDQVRQTAYDVHVYHGHGYPVALLSTRCRREHVQGRALRLILDNGPLQSRGLAVKPNTGGRRRALPCSTKSFKVSLELSAPKLEISA